MAHIQRLYDFQAGTKILSSQVNAEFNQLINYVNGLDDANSVLAGATGATKVGVSEGGNLQTLLDSLVRFATANIKYIRLNEDNVIETSANGVDWETFGRSGHLIQRANGTILPQRSLLQFTNMTITDDEVNDRTVVQSVVPGDMFKAVYDKDADGIVDNAEKVNGHTVESDVPSNAVFTDTVTTINGKTGAITKSDIVALGIPAQDTVYVHPTTAGNKHIPAGGASGQILRYSANGTAVWGDETVTPVVDNLTSTSTTSALSANQGRKLAEQIGTVSGKKTVRFVIGTSTAGWTAADCDYLCDGSNDATQIIAALNALPVTGGEVVILDGTYNITESIYIPYDNVVLRGNGNATILKRMYDSEEMEEEPYVEGLIMLNGKSGCKITDLQIDGNNNFYTSYSNYGILLYSSSNNTVTGNTCNNNSGGISLGGSNDNTVTGNTCNNNNGFGILLYSSSNNTVTGNTCHNNNGFGIYLASSSNNTVTGNTCHNNDSFGIYLASSSNNVITGNTCNNNRNGIDLYNLSDNTIAGNTCHNNEYNGIYLDSSNSNTITGNTCNNNYEGISLYFSNDSTITGNTCHNNEYSGIYLDNSNDNTITGSTCNNNSGGISLGGSNDNTITGNTCNNSDVGIFLFSSSNNTTTGNTCNNSDVGISLGGSNDNTIAGNTCHNNEYNGIFLFSSSNNTTTGNTCNNNNNYGIYLASSDNNFNCIVGNNLSGNETGYESDGGTGNLEANNVINDINDQ